MMKLPRPLTLMGIIAGVLVLAVIIELLPSEEAAVPAGVAPSQKSAPVTPAVAEKNSSQSMVETALSRPLFNPDRKPDKAETPVQTAAAADTSDLPRLAGILISSEDRQAIFQATADDTPQVLEEGGTIAGWTIEQISTASVSLSGPDGKKTVEPEFDPNVKVAEPALPAAAAAKPGGPPLPLPQRGPMPPGPAFDPRRFQPGMPGQPGMPFRPNMGRPLPQNMPRAPVQPGNH